MSEENFKRLVKDLGQNVGLPELEADQDLYCCLGFDDKITVHLQYHRETSNIMLFSQLGILTEDALPAIYPKMMKANVFWQGTAGSTLGIDSDNNEAIISFQIAVSLLDFPKFQEILENFINTAELWIDTVESANRGELEGSNPSSSAQASGGDTFQGPPPPGMRA